jgi:rRNA-processing protein FCF1
MITLKLSDLKKEDTNILFDTNFLFVTFKFKIDLISELDNIFSKKKKLFIYASTLGELESLKNRKSKARKLIPVALKFLEKYDFKIIENSKNETYVDKLIIDNLTTKLIIATNDKKLRKEITHINSKIKFLYLRQKNYLVYE